MPSFSFTQEALVDLDSIVQYTLQKRGKGQANNYVQNLNLLASRLAENPTIGKKRNSLRNELYSVPNASHILFYTETLKGIVIIRVLHKKMDISQHLK